jgi:PIN domain
MGRVTMATDDDLPFCVFLDTEAFRATSFDWSHPNLLALRERVRKGSIELVTTDIVLREMQHGISELLEEFHQQLQKSAKRAAVLRPLNDDAVNNLLRLAKNKPNVERLFSATDQFLRDLSVTSLPVPDTTLKAMFDMYFAGEPPFGAARKKSEFPDAANMLALLTHAASTGKQIYVISGDGDWPATCAKHAAHLVHVHRLSEMLDKAIRAEWLSDDLWSDEELLEFIEAKRDDLKTMLESALESASKVNLGDGRIESLTVKDISLLSLSVTDIWQGIDNITFRGELVHTVNYEAHVSIEDDEMHNTIEDWLYGSKELVATLTIELPLTNPREITIKDMDYHDGLNLKIPLNY